MSVANKMLNGRLECIVYRKEGILYKALVLQHRYIDGSNLPRVRGDGGKYDNEYAMALERSDGGQP